VEVRFLLEETIAACSKAMGSVSMQTTIPAATSRST
jgi:hypothetical protein